MADSRKFKQSTFYAQFPNLDKHHDSSNFTRGEWWESEDEDGNPKKPHRAEGGAVDAEPEMVKLSDHFK